MSVAFDTPVSFGMGGQVEELFVSELGVGEGIRSGGLDERHVELLMECVDAWPPIVVWGENLVVVDGCHRVEAARRLGRLSVVGHRFLGSAEEAFIEAIRRNVSHGLPLCVADRRRAARRVLLRNPDWSDRRIASLCGLSDKTVGRIRSVESLGIVAVDRRVGRDGKVRPVQPGEVRDRVRKALEENPTGSLRAIAAVAGASPETVRSVRARVQMGDTGLHVADRPAPAGKPSPVSAMPVLSVFASSEERTQVRSEKEWVADQALSACGEYAEWFSSTNITEDWHDFLWTIPLGRVYEIVDEARRRASVWTSFASVLEARTR